MSWTSPEAGKTFVTSVGSSAILNINIVFDDRWYYSYKIEVIIDNTTHININGTSYVRYDSFSKTVNFTVNINGVSTYTSTVPITILCSGDHGTYTEIERRTVYAMVFPAGTYDLTVTVPDPSILKKGDTLICPYSGAIKYCILPKGTYKLEAWGAKGGNRSDRTSNKYGKGGYCTGKLNVSQQTTYYCVTGGAGSQNNSGGYNGGGASGGSSMCSGGGASHISTVSSLLNARSSDYSATVLIVAGGGGGTSHENCTYGNNGDGGGQTGISGASYSSSYTVATGGTQSSGGSGGEG